MTTTEQKMADGEPKGRASSRRALFVGATCLLAGTFLGPKLFSGSINSGDSAPTTTLFERGPVLPLPPVTVNLVDGAILRVGIALQLPYEPEAVGDEEAAENEGTAPDPALGHAQDLEMAITVFGARTMAQLLETSGREAARAELRTLIADGHTADLGIEDLYFYEFVMQ